MVEPLPLQFTFCPPSDLCSLGLKPKEVTNYNCRIATGEQLLLPEVLLRASTLGLRRSATKLEKLMSSYRPPQSLFDKMLSSLVDSLSAPSSTLPFSKHPVKSHWLPVREKEVFLLPRVAVYEDGGQGKCRGFCYEIATVKTIPALQARNFPWSSTIIITN